MQIEKFVIVTNISATTTEVRRRFGLDAVKNLASGQGRALLRGVARSEEGESLKVQEGVPYSNKLRTCPCAKPEPRGTTYRLEGEPVALFITVFLRQSRQKGY